MRSGTLSAVGAENCVLPVASHRIIVRNHGRVAAIDTDTERKGYQLREGYLLQFLQSPPVLCCKHQRTVNPCKIT